MPQASLVLDPVQAPSVPPRENIFGTGIRVLCFGRGFPWQSKIHYNNWGDGGVLLKPYLDHYDLSSAVVPDLRGMNAYISDGSATELTHMDRAPHRLWRTLRVVDGIELAPKRSAFAISADCYTVLLVDTLKRRALLLHCARDSLHPIRRHGPARLGRPSIIDVAMERLMPTNPREVYALILCGIGPQSFENRPSYSDFHKAVVDHFVQTCGMGALYGPKDEGRLNIPLIICTQLGKWQVGIDNPAQITWDGIDTYTDARFNSRRQSADGNNCVLVDMEHAFR